MRSAPGSTEAPDLGEFGWAENLKVADVSRWYPSKARDRMSESCPNTHTILVSISQAQLLEESYHRSSIQLIMAVLVAIVA